jgi:hypothetical protein
MYFACGSGVERRILSNGTGTTAQRFYGVGRSADDSFDRLRKDGPRGLCDTISRLVRVYKPELEVSGGVVDATCPPQGALVRASAD